MGEALCFRLRDRSNADLCLDDGGKDSRDYRDRPRERSRDRDREMGRDRRRSRSPRRDKERERDRDGGERDREGTRNRDFEKEGSRELRADRTDDVPGRSATPVSFKVGGTPQPHEVEEMDVDATSSKPKSKNAGKGKKNKAQEVRAEDDDIIVEDDGMAAMQAMMGFGGFGTTQQKQVLGNDVYGVRKEKKTEYRQYMNRVGGFNRPLSPGRE